MSGSAVHQSELLCDRCGGQCVFSIERQALQCESCQTIHPVAEWNDFTASKEFPYDPEAPQDEPPVLTGEQVHHCQTCGGDVVFIGPALSDRCPYCNGPVVLGIEERAYDATALIPFKVTRTDALKNIDAWILNRKVAPKRLGKAASRGHLSAIYVPFWSFDTQEVVDYWATYKPPSSGNHTFGVYVDRHFTSFDDFLVPASTHVTPLIRDGILHDFDPKHLRPYRAAYLSGFAAERHHQSVAEGLAAKQEDKNLLIRNRVKKVLDRPGAQLMDFRTDTSGIHYRRILLPVWILHYEFGGRPGKIVVSGIDGRTYGERPFSFSKLLIYSALLTALAMMIGAYWGASAVP